jgi:hypothetical protein
MTPRSGGDSRRTVGPAGFEPLHPGLAGWGGRLGPHVQRHGRDWLTSFLPGLPIIRAGPTGAFTSQRTKWRAKMADK